MALTKSKPQRTIFFAVLFFAQGLPRGFMVIAVLSYLSQRGISDGELGSLAAIIILPWSVRFAWAPLLDTIIFRAMGRRRPWILVGELLMSLSLICLLFPSDIAFHPTLMATGFFLHSSFAALQDVATEALALDVIPVAEMGRLNGVMMAAKVLGKGLGAAALAFVIHTKGFRAAVITQIVLLLLIALLPLMVRERPGERILAWAIGPSDDIVPKHSLGQFFRTLTSSLLEWPVMSLLLLGCIASVGEEIVDVVTKPFYIKQLGWTYLQYSNVSGWAAVPIILGSLLGGWAADKLGCKRVIVIGFLTYGLLAISFGSLPLGSSNGWSATLFLLSESATTTFGSVAFFAIAMRISSGRLAVTVFSTLLASATLGHVIGDLMMSIFRGRLHWTYQTLLVFGGTLMIISLLLLRSVRERNTMLLTEPV